MRTIKLLGALTLVLALAQLGFGQASLPSTTLSAAVTSTSSNQISVASASSFVVGYACYVNQEYMLINSISGTNIGVTRGLAGTRAMTHASGDIVWVGPRNYFTTYPRKGTCTAANELNLPTINIATGKFYNCLGSVWVEGDPPPLSGIRLGFSTIPIGSVAYASVGTATTQVAGKKFWASVWIPHNMTVTGVKVLNAGTVGTDKMIAALYAGNGGAALAYSALAGTTTSGANAFQTLAFTSTYYAVGPARYFICIQTNGTTDNFRTIATSTFIDVLTTSATGTFGTLTSLTAPTTFTADVGPVAYVY